MKLIIDIPEEEFARIKDIPRDYKLFIHKIVANGTPLDDVKAEVSKIDSSYERDGCWVMADVLKILDNIGKESEE